MTDQNRGGHPVSAPSSPHGSPDPFAELPRVVPLGRRTPSDRNFDWGGWNPEEVARPGDLPPYLVLGRLDPASFALSSRGWSARWRGREADSFFEVAFEPEPGGWTIRQQWCGLDGGCASFAAGRPFAMSLLQGLLARFPDLWEARLRETLETRYAISLIAREPRVPNICGMPDGAIYTLLIPVAADRLRFVRHWLHDLLDADPPGYPISAEARLVFQAINHVEGRAPEWTQDARESFLQTTRDTGFPPDHLPVREQAPDGSAAWTFRRQLYCAFITVPFAGLLDLADRLATQAPASWTGLGRDTPFELRPVAIPAGLDRSGTQIRLWDSARSTRSVLVLSAPDSDIAARVMMARPGDEDRDGLVELARIAAISADLVRKAGADLKIWQGS